MQPTPASEWRFVFRRVWATPMLSILFVVSIAIGLTALGTMAGLIDALVYREPVGIVQPQQVVGIGRWRAEPASYPEFREIADRSMTLNQVGAFAVFDFTVRFSNTTAPVRGMLASGNLLRLLGTQPTVGRSLRREDDIVGVGQVAMVTQPFSTNYFGAATAAIGKTLSIGGDVFTIIGVLPKSFTAPDLSPVDVLLPLTNTPWAGNNSPLTDRNFQWLSLVGRLKPGKTPAQVSNELTTALRRSATERGSSGPPGIAKEPLAVRSLSETRYDSTALTSRITRWMAFVSVGVLIVGALNAVAITLVTRFRERRTHAIQIALGVPRSAFIARYVAEVLITLTCVVALATLASRAIWGELTGTLMAKNGPQPALNTPLIVLLSILAVTSISVCLAPNYFVIDPRSMLRTTLSNGTATLSRGMRNVFRLILFVQVALSAVIVVEALLFAASLSRALSKDIGIEPSGLIVATIDLKAAGIAPGDAPNTITRITEEISRLPGVSKVGFTNAGSVPGRLSWPVYVDGQQAIVGTPGQPITDVGMVTPEYFEAIGIGLAAGRYFQTTDLGSNSVVVSEEFVRYFWPSKNPIGQCVYFSKKEPVCASVVGVVKDRYANLNDKHGKREVYLAFGSALLPVAFRNNFLGREVAIRLVATSPHIADKIRDTISRLVPTALYVKVANGDEVVGALYSAWRLGAEILGGFGVVVVLLGALGIFGVSAYTTASRMRELSIRKVLGASNGQIFLLIVKESIVVTLSGLGVGLIGAHFAVQLTKTMAFGIDDIGVSYYVLPSVILFVAAVIATTQPALRAANSIPNDLLREQ